MSTAHTILIIDASGECFPVADRVLRAEGFSLLMAADTEEALRLMEEKRPELILADLSAGGNPLMWVAEAQRLDLAAQVMAACDKPNFNQAMDWVAMGLFNVLAKPLEEKRLRDLCLYALENAALFQQVAENSDLSQHLLSFYRGLAEHLDKSDAREYILGTVNRLGGIRGARPEITSAAATALSLSLKYQTASDQAARDSLTGLYNRRIFSEVLQREFAQARRHDFDLSLLSLDLDHFKAVNDNYGHQTGDEVLKAVARIIAEVARGSDLPARVGGEEFAIILPHTSQEQAQVLAERLRNMLAERVFTASGCSFRQTVSQGLAGTEHFMVKSAEDMVYWADQALYLAKREGRDAIRTVTDLSVPPTIAEGSYVFQ